MSEENSQKQNTPEIPVRKIDVSLYLHLPDGDVYELNTEQKALTEADIDVVVSDLREAIFQSGLLNVHMKTASGDYIIMPKAMLDRSYIMVSTEEIVSE